MSKYRITSVKSLSPLKRYEHIRETGFHVPGADGEHLCLTGQELDDYLDEVIWRKKHPGQEPIKEWEDDVPPQ